MWLASSTDTTFSIAAGLCPTHAKVLEASLKQPVLEDAAVVEEERQEFLRRLAHRADHLPRDDPNQPLTDDDRERLQRIAAAPREDDADWLDACEARYGFGFAEAP